MARSGTLSAVQERALLALLSERTAEDAAIAAKVGLRTLWRWLKDPAFSLAYRTLRAEAVSVAVGRLQQASAKAVDTLTGVMEDGNAPAAVKVTAASRILDLAIRATELEELKRRIAALEQHQEFPDEPAEEAPIVSA